MAFHSILPTASEARRLVPVESSRRIVQAFNEARAELRRQGRRDTLALASELLGEGQDVLPSTSTYQQAVNHLLAVDTYGISPLLSKAEAIARMRQLDPTPASLKRGLNGVVDARSDTEALADAVSSLLKDASTELTKLDIRILSGALTRYPDLRGSTKSALIDLNRWLAALERSL